MTQRQQLQLYPVLLLCLLAVLLIGPLWRQAGIPNSADGLLHLHRSAAVARSWATGVYWPRWFPDVYQGLGAPTFHYYSPLFYLLVGPLHLLGLPLDSAAKLVIGGLFLLSGLAVQRWLQGLLARNRPAVAAGLAGATLYLAQPHFFREFYFQGDYPQLIAWLLLPLCLWAFTALYDRSSWRTWLLAPLSLVLLVLAHNLTALLGATLLAFYWLLLGLRRRDWSGWWRGAGAAGLAVGVSAFFWMPALGDARFVQIQNLQQDFFRFDQYFLSWPELLAASPILDSRAANPPFPHLLGWSAWLAVLGGLVTAFLVLVRLRLTPHRQRRFCLVESPQIAYWASAGVAIVLIAILLTLPGATGIWETIPGLALLQFPARLLGVAGVGVALAGAATVAAWRGRCKWVALAAVILVTAWSSAVFLFPGQPFLRIETISPGQTQRYEQESNIWGLTSGNEFLPRWAKAAASDPGLLFSPDAVDSREGVTWRWITPHLARLTTTAQTALPAGRIVLPVHYFPAWRVTVNGRSLSIDHISPDATGLVVVESQQPVQALQLSWAGTAWQQRGQWVMWFTLLIWGMWMGYLLYRAPVSHASLGNRKDSTEIEPPSIEGQAPWAILALLLLLWGGRQLVVWQGWHFFQRHSPPGKVEGVANPLHVTLGSDDQPTVTLLGWALVSGRRPQPGDSLHVRLYWQGDEPIDEDLQSFLHLYSPQRQYSWAIAQNQNPGRIPTSSWLPALYYVDDLYLPLPLDLPPATFTLAAGLSDPQGNRLSVPDTNDGLVYLGPLSVQALKAGAGQPLQPSQPALAQVGPALRLQGNDLLPAPGGPILRLYWEALDRPRQDLVTFIHLVDRGGALVAQFDGLPLAGMIPTSQWRADSLYIDRRQLILPADLSPGEYQFRIGLYDPATEQRQPVTPAGDFAGRFQDDSLIVPLSVPEPN